MTIEIKNEGKAFAEYYTFKVINFDIVFVAYHYYLNGKVTRSWNAYDRFKMVAEPFLPPAVRSEALSKVFEKFRVMTFKEHIKKEASVL